MALTTQQKLEEAEEALHRLLTGTSVVSVTRGLANGGQRHVEFTKANIGALRSYIAELRAQIAGRPRARSRILYVVPR